LVVVAITLLVVMGFAALAIDLARVTAFKGELKGIADAAAMSAALDLTSARTQALATTNGQTLVGRNSIEGKGTATIASLAGVSWNFGTSTATNAASWSAANGVRVVASYTLNWTFTRIFKQGTSRSLVDTSIAAFGGRLNYPCLRPFAIPYSAIRSRLSLSPANDTTSLTAANLYALRGLTTTTTYTVLDTVNAANTTSFGWVNTNQGSSGTASNIVSALSSCVSGTLGAGSTLQARPGFGDTTTVRTAATTLCGSSTNCSVGTILIPVYTSGTNQTGTTTTTQTNTPAANQSVTIEVSKKCYDAAKTTPVGQKDCNSYLATLQTASAGAPVVVNGVSCNAGPTYTSKSSSGKKKTTQYFLTFQYTSCYTVTTTTTGSGRKASTYVIKYIAGFVWTARTNTTITGYFTTINYPPAGTGTWSTAISPVTSVVLVR
jgi:hypothetical protein